MNVISVLIGLAAAVLMVIGLIPLLGWLNWLVLAMCVVGVICGALSSEKNRAGLIINLAVAFVSVLRLFLGGGLF